MVNNEPIAVAAGFVILKGDDGPPENTPHTVYRVSSLRGGSVREPVPRWRW
jgi:hypothetical protein